LKRPDPDVVSPPVPVSLPYPAELIVRALAPMALPERVARIEQAIAARIPSVVAVVESLADPRNGAAILRTCEGLGVGEVHAIESDTPLMLSTRVTRGCAKWMDVRSHPTPAACASALRARGFALYVADMRAPRPLEEVARLPRVALAFGNEHEGVSSALRDEAEGAFAVPMRGMVESFNVSVAAAIALHAATRDRAGGLGEQEALALKARFLMESVRAPELIIARYLQEHPEQGRGL
jgi:tRNA (guanosine-2'-O-)-methyltransferase